MWKNGDIPMEMMWKILVLIPKGDTDNSGIGLLELLWKVVEAIIDTLLKAGIRLNEIIHGLCSGREMDMVILKLYMSQELDSMEQDTRLLVLLDLQKLHRAVDYDYLLMILEGYGAITHMFMLLDVFWDQQKVVNFQNGYHGPHFNGTRRNSQDRIISPTLFKLIFENMVQNCLALKVEDSLVAQELLGHVVGRYLGLFYSEGGVWGLQNPKWFQGAQNMIIRLFYRYGLVDNAAKSKVMTCQPGTLRSGILEEMLGQL